MSDDAAITELQPKPGSQRRHRAADRPQPQPRYNVILWNDNDHTYLYVVMMMEELFGHTQEKGYQIAQEVDKQGRAIVLTTTKEHAELKRDQIHAYGKDRLLDSCKGSMSATIEAIEEMTW